MTLRLIGANPCVTLFDGNRAVAYASVWRVDWSEQGGSGHTIVLGQQGSMRVVGADPNLSMWLADYDLGGTPNVLSTVWIPCATGAITVDGRRLTGEPRVDAAAPMSSAFIAEAEVWGWAP